MSNWYSLGLGDGLIAPLLSDQIEEAFRSRFEESGRSVEMAVFKRTESRGRLRCEVTAYFSPAASEIAQLFDAEPCAKPLRAGLDLLLGNPYCWALFYPESQTR